ncbi:phosphate regulon transcriptional regulator PhoB [Litorivivens sp.]|uniref:phosphate regulon transcriptional regulator PhoB n=1 Tax=Litorivivens sp. TaxID=2020868 RepID=UPI00356565D8
MANRSILIVDDESAIREMIRIGLEMAGFTCMEAADAQEAYGKILDQRPDLILLDWMMPNTSGLELLRRLRRDEVSRSIPVIMLTAKDDEDNRIQGLDVGADDYVTKPFSSRELLARIKAVLRRSVDPEEGDSVEVNGLVLDPLSHRVFADEKPVDMGPTEYKLLKFFMTHQERAYSRGQLLDQVWGSNVYVEERTVDVHIRRLRKALLTDSRDFGSLIQTVRGTGYRFSAAGLE